MGRYRPPRPPSSPHITADGYQALVDEAEKLWQRRTDVTRALAAAAAEGDRSENAEYIYRKKELREIDRRIRYLQKRLPDLKVIREPPADRQRVYFGASVRLEDDQGNSVEYRIVGADETDARKGWISIDSPMSTALLGKRLDDDITVDTPAGQCAYCITEIRYPAID